MIDLRSLEDSVKFSYTLVLDYSKILSRSATVASVLAVAVLAGLLTQFPSFGLAMVEVNAFRNLRVASRVNPWTSQSIKDATWLLIAFALFLLVMMYVADFWVIRTSVAPATSFRLGLLSLLDGPVLWFETHVSTPMDAAMSTFWGEPVNINPKLVGLLEGGIMPLLLLPVLGWIAMPYDPQWVINAFMISVGAMVITMYSMFALGGINLFVEKKWRIASCVPDFLLSDTAIRSRRISS